MVASAIEDILFEAGYPLPQCKVQAREHLRVIAIQTWKRMAKPVRH